MTKGQGQDRIARLEALLSVGGEPLALFGADGQVLVATRAFAEALARQPEELEGRALTPAELAAAGDERLPAQMRRAVATGQPVTSALPGRDLRLTPLRDADAQVWAVALAARTGHEALDAARRDAAEARAELERLRAERGRFLANAGHDLRQPFQAMHLFHHLLTLKITDGPNQALVQRLGEAIEAGEALVSALIAVSKLDAGAVKPERQCFPLDEVLGRLLDGFGGQAEAAGLRFLVRPSGRMVWSDPALVERLLKPYVANALRYTASGGVLLAARRRGNALRVEVWDTGPGIAEADREAVWEDFRQLGTPSRETRPALGLGLSEVKRLSAILDHPVAMRSRVGRGSVFSVDVPLADGGGGGSGGGGGGGGRVLVIEDDAMQREAVTLLLRDWGYTVVAAGGIDEALAAPMPDLVLADLRLAGGETGVEAIRALRGRHGRRLPAVVVSGDTDPERLNSVAAAELRLVRKPYDPAALRDALAHTLTLAHAG